MARRRKQKEFNPWPSFVDIFSSVILVLLFFLLFIIVLLAYYMQFKTVFSKSIEGKENSKTPIVNEYRNGNKVKTENKYINIHKEISKVKKERKKKKFKEIKSKTFLISFSNDEKFLTKEKYNTIESGLKYNKGFDKLIVTTYMISNKQMSLITKNKISLSRSINVMNFIKSKNIPINKVLFKNKKINLNKKYEKFNKNGFILFEFKNNKTNGEKDEK